MTGPPFKAEPTWLRLRGELDWTPRLSERAARAVGATLAAKDGDFSAHWVFPDGLRMHDRGRDHHYRKPLITLRAILAALRVAGVKEVSGWWLPLGHRCGECPHRRENYDKHDDVSRCPQGDLFACYPTPRDEDRWTVQLEALDD